MYVYIVQNNKMEVLMVYSNREDAIDYAAKYSGVNNPKSSEALYSVTEWFVIQPVKGT